MSSKSSKASSEDHLPDWVLVGRVRKPHGVKGEVLVEVLSDTPGRLRIGAEVVVSTADGGRFSAQIVSSNSSNRGLRLRLEGMGNRDDAEALRGAVFEVARDLVPQAPDGAYYYFELVNCRCVERNAGDLGRVVEVVEDGGGLLLRVEGENRELLVPFVESYLVKVDISRQLIELDLPLGLVEICTSKS